MTRPEPAPLVAVGEVVTVAEADYCYGAGPLRLRVTAAPADVDHPGLEWIVLSGREIWYDRGEPRDGRPRTALVRVAALRAARTRRPG